VLVSIDRIDVKPYSVVSIRSYVFNESGEQVSATRVNADAVVLRGRELIRLTIQRALIDVPDVAQPQAEIAEWARATEGGYSPADLPFHIVFLRRLFFAGTFLGTFLPSLRASESPIAIA
jgi:hypothetical protein